MIVGIGHIQQTGKSTSAQALVRDLHFKELSFAEPLKRLAYLTNPVVISANQLTNVQTGSNRYQAIVHRHGLEDAKRQYPEVRHFLQSLGVACREVFGTGFWVDRVMGAIDPEGLTVISDVRFSNEADAIKACGGKLIRITRPGKSASDHVSERELLEYAGFDATLDNDGDIPNLETKVVTLVQGWLRTDKKEAK